nr:MAG TPA: hypothetical protein [Caudoviricetes sp.]
MSLSIAKIGSGENTNYTTHAWLHRLVSAEFALSHISCGFEVYKSSNL